MISTVQSIAKKADGAFRQWVVCVRAAFCLFIFCFGSMHANACSSNGDTLKCMSACGGAVYGTCPAHHVCLIQKRSVDKALRKVYKFACFTCSESNPLGTCPANTSCVTCKGVTSCVGKNFKCNDHFITSATTSAIVPPVVIPPVVVPVEQYVPLPFVFSPIVKRTEPVVEHAILQSPAVTPVVNASSTAQSIPLVTTVNPAPLLVSAPAVAGISSASPVAPVSSEPLGASVPSVAAPPVVALAPAANIAPLPAIAPAATTKSIILPAPVASVSPVPVNVPKVMMASAIAPVPAVSSVPLKTVNSSSEQSVSPPLLSSLSSLLSVEKSKENNSPAGTTTSQSVAATSILESSPTVSNSNVPVATPKPIVSPLTTVPNAPLDVAPNSETPVSSPLLSSLASLLSDEKSKENSSSTAMPSSQSVAAPSAANTPPAASAINISSARDSAVARENNPARSAVASETNSPKSAASVSVANVPIPAGTDRKLSETAAVGNSRESTTQALPPLSAANNSVVPNAVPAANNPTDILASIKNSLSVTASSENTKSFSDTSAPSVVQVSEPGGEPAVVAENAEESSPYVDLFDFENQEEGGFAEENSDVNSSTAEDEAEDEFEDIDVDTVDSDSEG